MTIRTVWNVVILTAIALVLQLVFMGLYGPLMQKQESSMVSIEMRAGR